MELKDRIALARKQAGLSQEQLGDQLGVSRQAVSKWEAGQANPDVTYIAAMCRLFGVSSDWLLLGEESAQTAAPARCPGCQAIVTGLDQFCPNCGRSLRGPESTPESYTLLLRSPGNAACSPSADLLRLSTLGVFPKDSPLRPGMSYPEADALAAAAPIILARGLTREQLHACWDRTAYPKLFAYLPDSEETDPCVLAGQPGLSSDDLSAFALPEQRREPLSFGMVVLAVVLGVAGAVFLLSFL